MEWIRMRERSGRPRRPDLPPEERALIVAQWALWNRKTDEETRKRISSELSEGAQRQLDDLAERGGEQRVKRQLWHWMHDAMKPKREAGDLERFYAEELDTAQRQRLLSLPTDQMEAELEQMYLGSRLGLSGVEWLGGRRPRTARGAGEPRRDARTGPLPDGPGRRSPPTNGNGQ
jgi:hypothetical protein